MWSRLRYLLPITKSDWVASHIRLVSVLPSRSSLLNSTETSVSQIHFETEQKSNPSWDKRQCHLKLSRKLVSSHLAYRNRKIIDFCASIVCVASFELHKANEIIPKVWKLSEQWLKRLRISFRIALLWIVRWDSLVFLGALTGIRNKLCLGRE